MFSELTQDITTKVGRAHLFKEVFSTRSGSLNLSKLLLLVPDATTDSVKIKHTSAVHPEDEVLRSQNSSDEALQLQSAAGHVELGQNPQSSFVQDLQLGH